MSRVVLGLYILCILIAAAAGGFIVGAMRAHADPATAVAANEPAEETDDNSQQVDPVEETVAGDYPSTRLLTTDEIWSRAAKACGGDLPHGTPGMIVAFAKVTRIERILLMAGKSITEGEYYALLRYMIRKEFVAGAPFERFSQFFGAEFSPEMERKFVDDNVNIDTMYSYYSKEAQVYSESPDWVAQNGPKHLEGLVDSLNASDVLPELDRIKKSGRTDQYSLSDLAKNRAKQIVVTREARTTKWVSVNELLNVARNRNGSPRDATRESVPQTASPTSQKVQINVTVLKQGLGRYVPTKGLRVRVLEGPFTTAGYTDARGSVSLQHSKTYASVWLGGVRGEDPYNKRLWSGTLKKDLSIVVRIRESGTIEVSH